MMKGRVFWYDEKTMGSKFGGSHDSGVDSMLRGRNNRRNKCICID
jgi:hypothetical protein